MGAILTCHAGFETFRQGGAVEISADEDQRVHAGLVAPGAVELRVEEHVHALEHEAAGRALDRKHPFGAVEIAAFRAQQLADPGVEFLGVEVARHVHAHG